MYDLWLSLEAKMGFQTVFVPSDDGKWSGKDENGSYIGLLGMVYNGKADFLLANMYLSRDRVEYLGHTTSINTEWYILSYITYSQIYINDFQFQDKYLLQNTKSTSCQLVYIHFYVQKYTMVCSILDYDIVINHPSFTLHILGESNK